MAPFHILSLGDVYSSPIYSFPPSWLMRIIHICADLFVVFVSKQWWIKTKVSDWEMKGRSSFEHNWAVVFFSFFFLDWGGQEDTEHVKGCNLFWGILLWLAVLVHPPKWSSCSLSRFFPTLFFSVGQRLTPSKHNNHVFLPQMKNETQ